MGTYDFYDELTLEITGQSEVVEKLRDTYRYFETEQPKDPDIVCESTTDDPTPDDVLGGDEDYYGRAGDEFIIKEPWGEQMIISRDWDRIGLAPGSVHHHAAYIIEFELRKRLATKGQALVHASGVQVDGQTFIFPAWRHAGKTNTMLSLLRSGGDYLSDDRLWVDSEGSVRGYPLPINVMPSNHQSFGDHDGTNGIGQLRTEISDFVFDHVDLDRSLVDKALYFLTKHYVDVEFESELVSIDTLVPDAGYVSSRTQLDAIVLLRTTLNSADSIDITELDHDAALTDIANVSFYEWNQRLMEYFTAYDMLFSGGNRSAQLDGLIDEETRIVADVLDRTPAYRAHIPRSQDWSETGIEDEVVEQIGRVKRSASVDQLD